MMKKLMLPILICLLSIGVGYAQGTSNVGKCMPVVINQSSLNGNCVRGTNESQWDVWNGGVDDIFMDNQCHYFVELLRGKENGMPTSLTMTSDTGQQVPFKFQYLGLGYFDGNDCIHLVDSYHTQQTARLDGKTAYSRLFICTTAAEIEDDDPTITVYINYKDGSVVQTTYTASQMFTKSKDPNAYYGLKCMSSVINNGQWVDTYPAVNTGCVGPALYCKELVADLKKNVPITSITFKQKWSENMCNVIFGISGVVSYEASDEDIDTPIEEPDPGEDTDPGEDKDPDEDKNPDVGESDFVPVTIATSSLNGNCVQGENEYEYDLWMDGLERTFLDECAYFFYGRERGMTPTLSINNQEKVPVPFKFQWTGPGVFDGLDCVHLSGKLHSQHTIEFDEKKAYSQLYLCGTAGNVEAANTVVYASVNYTDGTSLKTTIDIYDWYLKSKRDNGYYGLSRHAHYEVYDRDEYSEDRTYGPALYCLTFNDPIDQTKVIDNIELSFSDEKMYVAIFALTGMEAENGNTGGDDDVPIIGSIFKPLTWDASYFNGNVVQGANETPEDVKEGGVKDYLLDTYGGLYYGGEGGMPEEISIVSNDGHNVPFKFQWAGDAPFDGNDCVHLTVYSFRKEIVFDNPEPLSQLYFCGTTGNLTMKKGSIEATVTYTDNTNQTTTITVYDWYQDMPLANGYYGLSRLEGDTGRWQHVKADGSNGLYGPALYCLQLKDKLDHTKAVKSISFYQDDWISTAIFAVTGRVYVSSDDDAGSEEEEEMGTPNFFCYNAYDYIIEASVEEPFGDAKVVGHFFSDGYAIMQLDKPAKVIAAGAFKDNDVLQDIILPTKLEYIGSSAFSNCEELRGTVKIPNTVTEMGDSVFYNDKQLTGIRLSKSLKSIPNYAFYLCKGLKGTLDIPNSVKEIGKYAFSFCKDITSVNLPNSLEAIYFGAFQSSGLAGTLNMPNSVTYIGDCAFQQCTQLEKVYISSSVKYLGDCNFDDTNVGTLIFGSENPISINSYTFSGLKENYVIYVPDSAVDKYKTAWGEPYASHIYSVESNQDIMNAVSAVGAERESSLIYDLSGRRLNAAPAKGVYIMNGRKYVK